PDADVRGLDGDPKILHIARAKAEKTGVEIGLDEGMSFALPYPDAGFDRVLSSLMLHHLSHADKIQTCSEVFRVLRSGGELHVADFGKPHTTLMRLATLALHRHGGDSTADNIAGRLPELFGSVGFKDVEETAQYQTLFGTLSLYKARKA